MNDEYVKGEPYFCDVSEKICSFPYLEHDISCDNLIVGGGIDGAITACYFAESGLDTALIDKNRLGHMCTSCATALLEYQLDEHAAALKKYFSPSEVLQVYRFGLDALDMVESVIKKLGNACHFSRRDTLIFSNALFGKWSVKKEYGFRKAGGLDVECIDSGSNPFPFEVKSGIIAKNGGAEFNPYLFEKQLIEYIKSKIPIFENTALVKIEGGDGNFIVTTNYGVKIHCKHIICCTGYDTRDFTAREFCEKFISFTIVSQCFDRPLWASRALLQDDGSPYHYMRLSPDNRLIIGGEDVAFKHGKFDVKVADKKYAALSEFAQSLFPSVEHFEIEKKFCGAFSATGDNLSVAGQSRRDGFFYNLGYGANGIVYSFLGAQIILEQLSGKSSPLHRFFSPDRPLP